MTRKRRNVNSVLKEVLQRVEPSEEELKIIGDSLHEFLNQLNKRLKALKINAEIFLGGSFAKATIIKKDLYDIDIFVRFDKEHKENELSKMTGRILRGIKNSSLIHGSRDYFRVNASKNLVFEIIPVKKIKNPKEAENITDLSYSHVNYIKRKLKNKKLLDEIRLAKAFCHANNCYGAESYIRGFSGYALELLVYHYGSFLKFIRAMSKIKDKKVIDIEKHYKNKNQVLMDINASKLYSPVILIDPTYKQRNVLAALSEETFKKFRKACHDFLKNPHPEMFESKKINLEKIRKNAKKRGYESVLLKAKTNKQEGDIAGSKLLKFYKHLIHETERFFEIKGRGFEYQGKKSARYLFVVKKKNEILISGPEINDKKNVRRFKKKHKKVFIKNKRFYSKEKTNVTLTTFIQDWKKKHRIRIKEMYITGLGIFNFP
ncbi:MAG TPA: hypothetical protein ENI22_02285 [Candidatus Pacearchaeota archaeon]|nr:hypothetical protein [Candidatus Pacearchaeota archaeon]